MAYIVDYAITENAGGGAGSVAVKVPPHIADDYLVCFAAVNGSTTFSMAGWTQIGTTQVANGGISSAVFFLKAAGSSTTGTLTITTPDDYDIKVICVRDADETNFLDSGTVVSSANTSTASQWTSPTMTTGQADSLVMYCHGYDGVAPSIHSNPGVMFLISSDSTGTTAVTSAGSAVAWYLQNAAGVTPGPGWTCSIGDDRTNHVFAIRNKVAGRVPAYADNANTVAAIVYGGHHQGTLNNLTVNTSLDIANIGPGGVGKATVYDAVAVQADYGINPYSNALTTTPGATPSTSVAGFQITLASPINMSSGFLVGTIIAGNPKMANYNHGSISEGGTYIAIASGTTANTDYRSYQVAAKDSSPNTLGRMVFSIQPSQAVTAYGTNGTFTPSDVRRFFFLSNCPPGTITLYTVEWFHVTKITCAGGSSGNPVDSEGLFEIGKGFRISLIERLGASSILALVPIQIGGGSAINFQINAGALQFPRVYNAAKKQINFHADGASAIGISYAGKSGDVIKHTNSVITSASPYYWEINSAATSAATWDFTGLTLVEATVTLRNVMTFDSMSFSACPSITINTGVTVSNSIFNACAEITANGGTFSSNQFEASAGVNGVISITANSEVNLQTELNRLTNNVFSGNTTPLGALRIIFTGVGGSGISLTMSSNTFTGNTTDIRWEAPALTPLTITSSGTCNLAPGNPYSASNSNTVTFLTALPGIVVTAVDLSGSPIQNAQVLLTTSNGTGPLPYQDSVTIVNSGTTATVTHTSHDLVSGDKVVIRGASHYQNNGIFVITLIDANSYSYTMSSAPGSNPTGTITSTFVAVSGLTDASGQITASRAFTADQPISGWARKTDSAPYYVEGLISGTIDSITGGSFTALLLSDE